MYAIIESGNKQYKIEKGDVIDVELLASGEGSVTFDNVLLLADGEKVSVGTPNVKGAKVKASVVGNVKDDKVISFKYKSKSNFHKTIGHRQNYTRLKIEEISN